MLKSNGVGLTDSNTQQVSLAKTSKRGQTKQGEHSLEIEDRCTIADGRIAGSGSAHKKARVGGVLPAAVRPEYCVGAHNP